MTEKATVTKIFKSEALYSSTFCSTRGTSCGGFKVKYLQYVRKWHVRVGYFEKV